MIFGKLAASDGFMSQLVRYVSVDVNVSYQACIIDWSFITLMPLIGLDNDGLVLFLQTEITPTSDGTRAVGMREILEVVATICSDVMSL